MDGQRDKDTPLGRAISATRTAFVVALTGGDARAAAACYTDTARLVAPSADLMEGRAAIEAFWKAGLEAGISRVELEPFEVERRGGLAYEIGRYALQLTALDGGTVIDRGSYLLVLARQGDGSWERAVEMFSPAAPPARTVGAVTAGAPGQGPDRAACPAADPRRTFPAGGRRGGRGHGGSTLGGSCAARAGARRAAPHLGRPSDRERTAGRALTASDMTNRQAAVALFISPKTVEANRAVVSRKLGIASRGKLGAVMAEPAMTRHGRTPTHGAST